MASPRAATRIARRLPAHPPSLRPHPAPCSCSGAPVVPGGPRRPARRLATAVDFEEAVERRTIDEASLKWGRYRRPYLSPGDPSPAPSLDDEVLPSSIVTDAEGRILATLDGVPSVSKIRELAAKAR